MKTTLVLEDEVVRKAKEQAAKLGMTLSALVERALRDSLAAPPSKRSKIVLPTSGHGLPVTDHSVASLRTLEVEE